MQIQWQLLWAWVRASPHSCPAFTVTLLQIDVLRINGYVSDHMDDGTRPGGAQKTAEEDESIVSRERC